jgi:hypothetical protein
MGEGIFNRETVPRRSKPVVLPHIVAVDFRVASEGREYPMQAQ